MIDVYSDFQCPACKTLYERTLVPLAYDYVDKGKVYLVHHEYPLPMHAHAMEAACYACAASRVGKYEQVCDVLFRQQETLGRQRKSGRNGVQRPHARAKRRKCAHWPRIRPSRPR